MNRNNHFEAGLTLSVIVVFWVLVFMAMTGCATVPMTDYERDAKLATDLDVYAVCEAVYEYRLVPMTHINHTHSKHRAPYGKARDMANLRDDIRTNNCRAIYRAAMRQ